MTEQTKPKEGEYLLPIPPPIFNSIFIIVSY